MLTGEFFLLGKGRLVLVPADFMLIERLFLSRVFLYRESTV